MVDAMGLYLAKTTGAAMENASERSSPGALKVKE
jgi:hypothetical protein